MNVVSTLTRGIFADTLRGLDAFRLFYPHLGLNYEVFLCPTVEGQEEYYLGKSKLSIYG